METILREAREAKRQLREHRRDMKARGLRRTSMFNGGQTMEQMRANEQCFRLEAIIQRAAGITQ